MWDSALQQVVSDSVARWAFMWKVSQSVSLCSARCRHFFLKQAPRIDHPANGLCNVFQCLKKCILSSIHARHSGGVIGTANLAGVHVGT